MGKYPKFRQQKWFTIKKIFWCKHERTITHYPHIEPYWHRNGEQQGTHDGIIFDACLNCGLVMVRDCRE